MTGRRYPHQHGWLHVQNVPELAAVLLMRLRSGRANAGRKLTVVCRCGRTFAEVVATAGGEVIYAAAAGWMAVDAEAAAADNFWRQKLERDYLALWLDDPLGEAIVQCRCAKVATLPCAWIQKQLAIGKPRVVWTGD